MALEKFKLTLNPNSDDYQYLIYPIIDVRQNMSKDAVSIALPGQSARNNILMGLSGMESEITINFYIHDDGTDRANGSYSDEIKSLSDQVDYLLYTIYDSDFDSAWELDDVNGDLYDSEDVYLDEIDIPVLPQDSPKWLEARMRLIIGESIS